MSSAPAWPGHFSDILVVGNPNSNVGVCTLWAVRATIAQGLDKNTYAAVGNMFYNDGINYLVRNVFLNPNIRYIVLCGKDIAKSGEMFLKFMEQGIDANHTIPGTTVQLHKEIPQEAFDLFRTNVRVIDMRDVIDPAIIQESIHKLSPLPAFTTPQDFPLPKIEEVDRFPSFASGYTIRGRTIAQTWIKIIRTVMKFGYKKMSEQGSDMREVLNLVAVVEEEDPTNFYVPEYLPFSREEVENYLPTILTPAVPPGIQYTYGNRLRDHPISKNQIQHIIDALGAHDFSRRAVAVLWNHEIDPTNQNPPCWVALQAIVQDKKLFLTCFIRSNDMYSSWVLNAFGLRKMQQEIATALSLGIGSLTTISCSAHIYQHDVAKAQETLKNHDPVFFGIEYDPRGNFRIDLDRNAGEIVVSQYAPNGKKIGEFRGKAAIPTYRKMIHANAASVAAHWADIGIELGKAEIALKNGLKYEQDQELKLSEKVV